MVINYINENNKSLYTFKCKGCGKEYTLLLSDREYNKGNYTKYCSRSCANKRILTDETKNKISKTLLDKTTDKLKHHTCVVCGKDYTYRDFKSKICCSQKCLDYYFSHRNDYLSDEVKERISTGGRNSAQIQSEKRRSKNEIYFCELCENTFEDVKHNINIFNNWDADIIIEDIKFAVLWNGPWHYRKITSIHSVEQVKNRDSIKIQEIRKLGYTPYIIKDDGKFNKQFVEEEFNKFINYLISNRYINNIE